MPELRKQPGGCRKAQSEGDTEVAQCSGSRGRRLPERRADAGTHMTFRAQARRAGIGPESAADAVPEEPKGGCRKEILCRYMLATLGANIVCIPEVTLKSLKIRR